MKVVAAGPDFEPIQPIVMEVGVTPGAAAQDALVAAEADGFGAGAGAALALVATMLSSTDALAPAARAADTRVLRE